MRDGRYASYDDRRRPATRSAGQSEGGVDADALKLSGCGRRRLTPADLEARARQADERLAKFSRETTVVGLDLAARVNGWAFVQDRAIVASGAFKLPDARRVREDAVGLARRRCEALSEALDAILSAYRPVVLAYEFPDQTRPAWSGGSKGREMTVSRALGIVEGFLIMLTVDLPVRLIAVPASTARRALTGARAAPKNRVRLSLTASLGLSYGALDDVSEDAVDACMIALAVLEA